MDFVTLLGVLIYILISTGLVIGTALIAYGVTRTDKEG